LGFDRACILLASAGPVAEPLKVFWFPFGHAAIKLEAIEQPAL
jgi:hypothetical protein